MKNLANLRKNAGYKSQAEFAKVFGIPKNTYSHYECGINEPSIATLIRLADFFGVSVDYLLGHETAQIVHLDSYTENQQKAITLMQKLNDDEMLVLLGYLARITNTPLEEVLQRKV